MQGFTTVRDAGGADYALSRAIEEGVIAVQVHVGPVMKIQYRDFFVKHLPDDLPLLTSAQAPAPTDAVKVVPQGAKAKPKAKK